MTTSAIALSLIKIYDQGGIVVIPLSILSIVGFAIFLQKTVELFRRAFIRKSSIINKIPSYFTLSNNYYKLFLSKAIPAKNPSKEFLKHTQEEVNTLHKDLWIIDVIVQLAPILGILGTIIGVMQSIQGVDLSQEQGMKAVSKGFSKALITSIYGLSLACLFQLYYSFLLSSIQNIQNQFTKFYYEIVEWESNQNESL